MGGIAFLFRNLEEIVAGIFMTVMSLATISNVVARYVFNSPIQWAEELSRYSFIWLVFMGAAICTKQKRHIAIDSLLLALPARVQPLFHLAIDLVTLGLMAIMFYYSLVLIQSATHPTAELKIPQFVVYLVVPISAALIFLYTAADLGRHVRSLLAGGGRE